MSVLKTDCLRTVATVVKFDDNSKPATMKNIITSIFVLSIFMQLALAQDKQQVLPEEPAHITESNVLWTGGVSDTLEYCVVNASNLVIMNQTFPKEKNITRQASFKLVNKDGEGRTVNGRIAGVTMWNGKEHYTAELEVGINFQTHKEYRKVACVLADLQDLPYKLYIGRNWLGDDMEIKK